MTTPTTTTTTAQNASLVQTRIWSAYQLSVFRDVAEGRGHTFVSAVAGSGKSTTMEEGLTHIPQGKQVMVCAFNKEIATAFTSRLARTKSRLQPGVRVEASTLHSYGFRQIKRAYGTVELNADKSWMILDELLSGERIAKELSATLVKCTSLAKSTLANTKAAVDDLIDTFELDMGEDVQDDDDAYLARREWFVALVLRMLARAAEITGVVDFDDMIWLPVKLNLRVWQFDRIFVDEVQDLNPCQIELVIRACKRDGRILAVGDENQAIYAFRGADENAVKTLVSRVNAKTLLLSVSYRCPKSVVLAAQYLVPHLEYAPNANDGSVTAVTTDYMLAHVAEGDFVLSRSNAPLVGACLKLLSEGRRAMIAGKDIGKSLVSLVRRAKTNDVGELLTWIEKWSEREVLHLQASDRPKESQIQTVQDKAATILALCEGAQSTNEVMAKIEGLFSDDVKAEEKVVFSTTHKAKGLERKNVWLLRDTYLRRQSQEESNLLYVAMTRAMENLYMAYDKRDAAQHAVDVWELES